MRLDPAGGEGRGCSWVGVVGGNGKGGYKRVGVVVLLNVGAEEV